MDLEIGSHTQPSWPRVNPKELYGSKDSPWFSLTGESLGCHWPLKKGQNRSQLPTVVPQLSSWESRPRPFPSPNTASPSTLCEGARAEHGGDLTMAPLLLSAEGLREC